MSEKGDLFKREGTLPGTSKLYLHENAVPEIAAARYVPKALKSRFIQELDQMYENKIRKCDQRDLEKFGTKKVLQKDDHLYLVQLMD